MRSMARCFIPLLVAAAGCASSGDAPAPGDVTPSPAPAALARSTLATVSWPAPERVDRQALGRLRPDARAALALAPVPVLVPSAEALLGSVVIVTDEHWASAWAQADGVTVTVSGTRLAHRVPSIAPIAGKDPVRAARGFVTENEGIWSATWPENGVVYTLDVECADPAEARCADRAWLLGLASELVYVGGAATKEAP
jgi:hypothetical protein